MRYEETHNLSEREFRRKTGLKRKTFAKAVEILERAEAAKRKKGGHESKLSVENMLLLTMEYLREYLTYFSIGLNFGVDETWAMRISRWVEDTLIKDRSFTLPGKKTLRDRNAKYKVIQIDATESPIERPKRGQKRFYSGKKKRHTLKTQVIVDKKTRQVIAVCFANGKRHDFRIYKESNTVINPEIRVEADSGYTGIKDIHANSVLPTKKPKNDKLTKEQKKRNREISRERVTNEHEIGFVKRFWILSERYRNRRKRFGLRFTLICGLCNYDMTV